MLLEELYERGLLEPVALPPSAGLEGEQGIIYECSLSGLLDNGHRHLQAYIDNIVRFFVDFLELLPAVK